MNAKESTTGALKHLRKTIEEQGHVHLIRIVRKHLTENPRIKETVPTFKSLFLEKVSHWRNEKSKLGLEAAFEQEKGKLKDFAKSHLLFVSEGLVQYKAELKKQSGVKSVLAGLSRTAGLQWGALLPPRNLKLQHHKLEQHFILFRRVPIFIAEVSTEWWSLMLEQALRKCIHEQEKQILFHIQSVVHEFKKGFEQGMDIHTYLQQAFSLKKEVVTAKDVTLPLDPFSFQLIEHFFASLLNPPKENE